jgi:hypothetical protein
MNPWSDPLSAAVSNYRVRTGNEQFALSVGVTLIGRDASCRIAIFDALISRRHARIQCDGDQAVIEDLGSRNGTRVNGVLISGPHTLREGDRIGIGSHELTVTVEDRTSGDWEADTGLLSLCKQCRCGYPAEEQACPRCGAANPNAPSGSKRIDGRPDDTSSVRWTLGMLLEMIGKAILTRRGQDAERIMREAAILVGQRLRDSQPLTRDELVALTESAAWLDKTFANDRWTTWIATINPPTPRRTQPPPRP